MRFLPAVALAFALNGCLLTGVSPLTRVSDAARETNMATRFGQMDLALGHVAAQARPTFIERRAQWGQGVRILEVELSAIHIVDEEHASVVVDVSWTSLTDSLLRSTQLTQEWENQKAGWVLTRERRLSGELGLFGEALTNLTPPHPDVHRPSRTLQN